LQFADYAFELPNRWPLYPFFGRFNAHVESSFILITSWNFHPYRAPDFCHDFMDLQRKRTHVWPRLVYRNGLFMDHTYKPASAMPTMMRNVIFERIQIGIAKPSPPFAANHVVLHLRIFQPLVVLACVGPIP
jgi:hypothetical protein